MILAGFLFVLCWSCVVLVRFLLVWWVTVWASGWRRRGPAPLLTRGTTEFVRRCLLNTSLPMLLIRTPRMVASQSHTTAMPRHTVAGREGMRALCALIPGLTPLPCVLVWRGVAGLGACLGVFGPEGVGKRAQRPFAVS